MKRAANNNGDGDARKRTSPEPIQIAAGWGGLNRDVWSLIMAILRKSNSHRPLAKTCRKLYDVMRTQTTSIRINNCPRYNNLSPITLPRPALMRFGIGAHGHGALDASRGLYDMLVPARQRAQPGFSFEFTYALVEESECILGNMVRGVSVVVARYPSLMVALLLKLPGAVASAKCKWPCMRIDCPPDIVDATRVGLGVQSIVKRNNVRYLLFDGETEGPAGFGFQLVTLAELRAEALEEKLTPI